MLFHIARAEMSDDGVPVALVRDDGHGHRVNWSVWWTDEHCAMVVLSGHVAYIAVFLDNLFDAMSFAEYVVKDKVCAFPQAEDTHTVRGLHTRQLELNADKLVFSVYFHAFAMRIENARLLCRVLALTHIAFFVRAGHNRHGIQALLWKTGEHFHDTDF